ncbi:MAG: hypothetical protein ACKO5C_02290 [Ferruginibacter sp.]
MKRIYFSMLLLSFFGISCSSDEQSSGQPDSDGPVSFFPVNRFFLGEIEDIKKRGLSPVCKITVNGKTDSTWLKHEQMHLACADFLQPAIDSSALSPYFRETTFLDETIQALTLDTEPKAVTIPDSIPWTGWSVYVDPSTQNVKRILLTKKAGTNKEMLLTWITGKSCKIQVINKEPGITNPIEKETSIRWDF